MFCKTLFITLSVALASTTGVAKDTPKRTIPCKTPAIANKCYWTHGRLGFMNGTPALRLWKIGTHRILGIYSGPSSYRGQWVDTIPLLDNEDPQLPGNVTRIFNATNHHGFPDRIFADFEVCPLEAEKPGSMQAACIESAKNIIVEEEK